jgi:hypothetical protein
VVIVNYLPSVSKSPDLLACKAPYSWYGRQIIKIYLGRETKPPQVDDEFDGQFFHLVGNSLLPSGFALNHSNSWLFIACRYD